jgi:hypothetical protein
MNKYLKIFVNITTIVGGITKILELLKLPEIINNPATKEIAGHLQWIGNLCWYVGIPSAIIYLIKKVRDLEADNASFQTIVKSKIETNDNWVVENINDLRKQLNN